MFALMHATLVSSKYLPIFMMHGLNDDAKAFDKIKGWLRERDGGVVMHSLHIAQGSHSYKNLDHQGNLIHDAIKKEVAQSPEIYKHGYTLLCHSQGALTCRTVVQRFDSLNVHTLIAMAGPQGGQYGIPAGWQKKVPWARGLAFEFMYTDSLQKSLSIANFWKDPRTKASPFFTPRKSYCKKNDFLPKYNADPCRYKKGGHSKHAYENDSALYKKNLLRLKKLVLTAGAKDDTIIPWQSGVFEFCRSHAHAKCSRAIPLKDEKLYWADLIGLKELNQTNRLVRIKSPHAKHKDWIDDTTTFHKYIVEHLPTYPQDVVV